MTDELERFVDRVKDRAGHPDRDHVQQAIQITLRALGSHLGGLPPAVHDAIPRVFHAEVEAGDGMQRLRPAELYQHTSEQLELRVGMALELVQSTLAELAELLAAPGRELLRELLPPAWAVLIPDPDPPSRPRAAPASPEPAIGHTLASGRPGGTRPLADAALPGGQNDSIATSDEPHRGRLASAHGPGPQQDDRTLAKGRPGSKHPLSDSD